MNDRTSETWYGVPEESTSLTGPDYVALVIEWDDSDVTQRTVKPASIAQRFVHLPFRAIAKVAGTVGAIALAIYAFHRLRTD